MKCPKCNNDNPDDALYCGVCYESFKKPENTEEPRKPPVMAREVNKSSELSDEKEEESSGLLKILFIGILCVGGYFAYKAFVPSAIAEAPIIEPGTIAEKIELAERFLYEHDEARSAFFDDLEKRKLKLKGFKMGGKYSKKYMGFEKKHLAKFNALKLPCPSTEAAYNEPGYIKWSKDYQERGKMMMDKYNQRYKQIVDKTARAEYPDAK